MSPGKVDDAKGSSDENLAYAWLNLPFNTKFPQFLMQALPMKSNPRGSSAHVSRVVLKSGGNIVDLELFPGFFIGQGEPLVDAPARFSAVEGLAILTRFRAGCETTQFRREIADSNG